MSAGWACARAGVLAGGLAWGTQVEGGPTDGLPEGTMPSLNAQVRRHGAEPHRARGIAIAVVVAAVAAGVVLLVLYAGGGGSAPGY